MLRYASGDVYDGEWKNDMKDGVGKLLFASGGTYNGEWLNNTITGKVNFIIVRIKKGIYSCPAGLSYNGEWMNNSTHGSGTMYIPLIGEYTGQWLINKQNGLVNSKFAYKL